MKKEGLRVLNAEITNFKNITHKEINFGGRSAIVIGKNRQGKSSFLQAICSPINSKFIPLKPVKDGEERASVELTIGGTRNGEEETYALGLYFSPDHQRGRVTIHDGEGGTVPGGKKLIEDIVGNIGFDIMEFLRKGKTETGRASEAGVKEQINILKNLMPKEDLKDLNEADQVIKENRDKKNKLAKSLKEIRVIINENEYTQEEIEKYSKRKDPKEVQDKINNLQGGLEKWNSADQKKSMSVMRKSNLEDRIEELEKELKDKKEQLKKEDEFLEKAEAWFTKNPKPEIGSLTDELNEINEHNKKNDVVTDLEKKHKEARELKESIQKADEDIENSVTKKKEVFARKTLPVKDLSFDENQIMYKGLPFQEDQHPTSVLIAVGLKIAMAMNPNLRLLIVKDGSLLDKDMLKYVLSICEKEDYQLLIEMVGEGEMKVEFTEEDIDE